MPLLKKIHQTLSTRIALLSSIGLLMVPLAALALQPDQVRGKVLAVDPEFRFLTIQIEASGDEAAASIGSVHTYFVPESVTPEQETTFESITYRSNDDVGLDQLTAGDEVTLDFRMVDRRFEFERLTKEEASDIDARAAVRSHEITIVEADRAPSDGEQTEDK